VSDEDGDTPLYTVENIETARFLVDKGADLMWRNNDGLTVCHALVIHIPVLRLCQPAASLEEDFPLVADFLSYLTGPHDGEPENRDSSQLLSEGSQEAASEHLTSSLMSQISDLAQNEPIEDEQLRQAVGHVVLESLVTGYSMVNGGTDSDQTGG
jgi:uncharacterized protein